MAAKRLCGVVQKGSDFPITMSPYFPPFCMVLLHFQASPTTRHVLNGRNMTCWFIDIWVKFHRFFFHQRLYFFWACSFPCFFGFTLVYARALFWMAARRLSGLFNRLTRCVHSGFQIQDWVLIETRVREHVLLRDALKTRYKKPSAAGQHILRGTEYCWDSCRWASV